MLLKVLKKQCRLAKKKALKRENWVDEAHPSVTPKCTLHVKKRESQEQNVCL